MSTYDDNLLAARFAALAPEPLAGNWDEVLDRAGAARKGRRGPERSRVFQGRRRLPLCSRGPGVHARPDRRQLDDTRLPECAGMSLDARHGYAPKAVEPPLGHDRRSCRDSIR